MKIGVQIALMLALIFVLIGLVRHCDPFTYFENQDKPILKGGVYR